MKILFLTNQLLNVCGVTKHFYHLLRELREFYPDNEYFVICGGGNAIEKFEKEGIKVIVNKNIKHETRSVGGYLKAMSDIYGFVKKNNIDIIHSHHHYAASIADKISKIANVKTILTTHGLLPEIGRLNHFSAEHIIAVNEHIFEYVKKQTNGKHVYLVRNGINEYSFISPKANKMMVVVASRLVYDKGIDIFIKAVSLLPKSITEQVDFIIAGDGENKRDYLKLNTELNTKIIFIGIVENTQKLLNKSHILVNPTCSKEGFPTILVEAGLQKNLIVSSNFFGHDFILKDKENCLIFNQGDIISLKEKLIIAINEYSSNEEIIDKFYSQCKKLYSVEGMIKKIKGIYEFAQ